MAFRMDTFLAIVAVLLGAAGILGSFLPVLPGPPLSWLGMLVAYFRGGTDSSGDPMGTGFLLVWLGITVAVTVLDYVVPAWFTKLGGGSKYAGWGATAGLLAGLLLPLPAGMIGMSIAGAFIAELLFARKSAGESIKASLGAFAGFLFGTGIKLAGSAAMLYYIIVYI